MSKHLILLSDQKREVCPEQKDILLKEYEIAFAMFQMQNAQAWQTFSIVSSIAVAALAFVGSLKAADKVTWPVSLSVGISMIFILVGWLLLANRWWAYAQSEVYRLMDIEERLGMYLFKQGTWLRKPLKNRDLGSLSTKDKLYYHRLRKAFPQFPRYRWRQQVLTSMIVGGLVITWVLFILADIFQVI